GRDHQQIVCSQPIQQLGNSRVKSFERSGVSVDIAPVSMNSIEVDEIREKKSPVFEATPTLQRAVEQSVVAVALLVTAGSAVCEDIVDLSDGDDVAPLRLGRI